MSMQLTEEETETLKHEKAEQILHQATLPGFFPVQGQLDLPGFGTCDYEPERLIRHDGTIIENERALPEYKKADADYAKRRAIELQINAEEATEWADQLAAEASLHAEWAREQTRQGRTDLTFGRFIREMGYLSEPMRVGPSDADSLVPGMRIAFHHLAAQVSG
jgi:hypothetical protein